jgi:sorbitol-specific phosphotransferase system component IIA
MLSGDLRKIVAAALVFSTTLITLPVSAADFTTPKSVIGSVSGVGPVELRGVGISQEGTLFPGDRIRAGQKGYAKVLLGTGSKIELAELTDVSINRDAQGVKIAMNTGTVGFTTTAPLRIDVLPFEVIATDGAAGHVALMNSNAAGVRAVNGKIMVRNLKTAESFVLTKGQERLLNIRNGAHAPSLAEIASNVPGPVPAPFPAPQAPAGRTSGGLAMDTGAWLAVIGGAAIAGVAIWGLIIAMDNRDDNKELRNDFNDLQTSTQQQLKNISNASAIANTAAQSQAQMASVAALAGQAQLALTAAGNAGQAAAAASLAAQASANQTALAALQSQLQALQAQFAAGGGSSAQLSTLLSQEEALRNTGNTIAANLNTLLNNNRTTPGVPTGSVGTVGPPVVASASAPV